MEYTYKRRKSRKVWVGDVAVGGDASISVQSMTKTKTADVKATVAQIESCRKAGVDIMRVTVNSKEASSAFAEIVKQSIIPIVADIHFNHIFALEAIKANVAKIRINPGNIGSVDRVKQVLSAAKERSIPIRIGVNSGSLEKDILQKYGHPTAEALYESAMRHIHICQENNFDDVIIAVKSTSVPLMIEAYRMIADKTDYPLHLGVTEAGTNRQGTIKTSIGVGTLLSEGIGDTIRVSLTDLPEKEVETGIDILRAIGLRNKGIEIISCPTCGRLEADLMSITKKIEVGTRLIKKDITIAVMGCIVNGPGEAQEADVGVACGRGKGIIFKNGVEIKTVKEEEITSELLSIIQRI